MASTSTCTTAQQQQAIDYPSKKHIIQFAEQHPSKRVDQVLASAASSDASFHLPAPTKFNRKAARMERAASVDKAKITNISMEAQLRRSMYTSHRQYVHSLIIQTESFDDSSSSRDLWAACDRFFEMN
jgi:hypothetical protein